MDVTHLKYIESVWKINKQTIMALLLTVCFTLGNEMSEMILKMTPPLRIIYFFSLDLT